MIRILKIAAAVLIGLIGTLAFLNNLFNITSAQSFVSAVISAPEQPFYKVIGPTFESGWQGWLGLCVIMAGELLAGLLGFIGAARMTSARLQEADGFQAAKSLAIAGGMIGTIVWYGMFVTLGEMYFNMWQTEIGLGSVAGAFRYGTVCAVMTFLIAMRDD
jgi:predicted small integral membrane protein